MIVTTPDQTIIDWAEAHQARWYYTEEPGLPTCLKVHSGHVTAYFDQGRLVRIWAHADRAELDDMFAELAKLLAQVASSDGDEGYAPDSASSPYQWGAALCGS